MSNQEQKLINFQFDKSYKTEDFFVLLFHSLDVLEPIQSNLSSHWATILASSRTQLSRCSSGSFAVSSSLPSAIWRSIARPGKVTRWWNFSIIEYPVSYFGLDYHLSTWSRTFCSTFLGTQKMESNQKINFLVLGMYFYFFVPFVI